MRTEELVNILVADASSASRPFARTLAAALICGAATAGLLFLAMLKVRPDLGAAASDARFWLKLDFALALAFASFVLTRRAGEPGAEIGRWRYALLAAPAVLLFGVAIECFSTPVSEWGARLVGQHAGHCLLLIPTLAAPALACALSALRQGAPTRPAQAGALAGLLAGAIAAGIYALHCPDDSPLFLATWYPLAITIVTGVGAAIGNRALRW